MMCNDIKCPKLQDDICTVYSIYGQAMRCRIGYCPIPDDGPNKVKLNIQQQKVRSGQQKQKKKK